MSAAPILAVHRLSKVYRRYARPSDRLLELMFGWKRAQPVHALDPISFELQPGEALGVVGRNGSGKSTLLRLIAGVLTPSTGSVVARGRISALLELGGGFNPEFTGRENVFFSGAMLGFDREHMNALYPGIVTFADIGAFIDEPVRTYSTGMFVRLAFAVAISVEPDILIVDEALAVGDIYFQQKCFDRIRELRARGTTLLLVSHDSGAIYRFCDRAILLDAGAIVYDGKPREVIERYEASLIRERDAAYVAAAHAVDDSIDVAEILAVIDGQAPTEPVVDKSTDSIIDKGEVVIRNVELLGSDGSSHLTVICGEERALRIELAFVAGVADPHIGFKLRDRFGAVVYETNTYTMGQSIGPVSAGEHLDVDFVLQLPIAQGEYTVTVGVADGGVGEASFERQLLYVHDALEFRVLTNPQSGIWSGAVDLRARITTKRGTPAPVHP